MASLLDIIEKEGRIGLQKYYFEKNKDNLRLDIGKKKITIYRYDRDAKHGLWSIDTEAAGLSADIRKYITDELKGIIQAHINSDIKVVKRASDLLYQYGNDTRSIHDQVINLMKTYQKENGIGATFDANKRVINFKNGILELDTGNFRDRTRDDYITKCLNYDYTEKYNKDIMKEIIDIYMKVFNNDPYQVNTQLLWDAYCITGETSEQKFMIYLGESGGNGKSMLLQIKENVFNNGKDVLYVYKCDNDIFNPKCQTRNKDVSNLLPPCRLAYIEELDEAGKIDMRLVKDFVSGSTLNCKPMYQESINFIPHCKWSIATNDIPEFDTTDEAFNRRPLLQPCNNKFVEEEKLEYQKEINTKSQVYVRDGRLAEKFLGIDYKIAYINLLLKYTIAYFNRGTLYNITYLQQKYIEKVIGFDFVKDYIDNWLLLTGETGDIIPGVDLFVHFSEKYKDSNIGHTKFLSIMKRKINDIYDSQLRKDGKKGFYVGLKIIDKPKGSTQSGPIQKEDETLLIEEIAKSLQ